MQMEVFIKSIGELQSAEKKDGSGTWYARDLVLEVNQNCLYRDTFCVRYTGEKAVEPALEVGKLYEAEISFSTRTHEGRVYQDAWLRNLKRLTQVSSTGEDEEPFY